MEKNIIESVKEVLGLSNDEIEKNVKELPEINAFYFWSSERGGNAIIINAEGERLIAGSAVRLEDHVKAFEAGRRN
ncbi:MAG: hypothetical protein SPE18_08885 [Candidatus Limivicinus sp.]|nr:hypothetical protein [Candidatus Limivicinus sp.]